MKKSSTEQKNNIEISVCYTVNIFLSTWGTGNTKVLTRFDSFIPKMKFELHCLQHHLLSKLIIAF